jgi:hypothetical protein
VGKAKRGWMEVKIWGRGEGMDGRERDSLLCKKDIAD